MSNFSTMLYNKKAEFAVVDSDDKKVLVCTNNVGVFKILYIEDLKTGKRAFPAESQYGKDPFEVFQELLVQL
ncbi:hypothetical protein [Mesobacillus jeotgali]|uniref:hypothetical protein n=1 Tax=Mesobacillus jeotgali TaxID=129985 RepID=UPI001CFDBE95|nr:hypothetical protein [Mesobacillus jeotgali]